MVVLQESEDRSTALHLLLLLHEVVDNLPMNVAMTKKFKIIFRRNNSTEAVRTSIEFFE